MKKRIALILCLCAGTLLWNGCGGDESTPADNTVTEENEHDHDHDHAEDTQEASDTTSETTELEEVEFTEKDLQLFDTIEEAYKNYCEEPVHGYISSTITSTSVGSTEYFTVDTEKQAVLDLIGDGQPESITICTVEDGTDYVYIQDVLTGEYTKLSDYGYLSYDMLADSLLVSSASYQNTEGRTITDIVLAESYETLDGTEYYCIDITYTSKVTSLKKITYEELLASYGYTEESIASQDGMKEYLEQQLETYNAEVDALNYSGLLITDSFVLEKDTNKLVSRTINTFDPTNTSSSYNETRTFTYTIGDECISVDAYLPENAKEMSAISYEDYIN